MVHIESSIYFLRSTSQLWITSSRKPGETKRRVILHCIHSCDGITHEQKCLSCNLLRNRSLMSHRKAISAKYLSHRGAAGRTAGHHLYIPATALLHTPHSHKCLHNSHLLNECILWRHCSLRNILEGGCCCLRNRGLKSVLTAWPWSRETQLQQCNAPTDRGAQHHQEPSIHGH